MKLLFIALSAFVLFTGCSSKNRFEPENVASSVEVTGRLDSKVVQTSRSGANLEDGQAITIMNGLEPFKIDDGYRIVGANDEYVCASSNGGLLKLYKNRELLSEFSFSKNVASASANEDFLAILFVNNDIALYSIKNKELIFKQGGDDIIAVDTRVAQPQFLNDLILYATLDGKIIILNSETKKPIRSIVLSDQQYFNNIIYMKMYDNVLIAATGSSLYSLTDREARKDISVRDVSFGEYGLYVATKEGEVLKLSRNLEEEGRLKFDFAHFLGMAVSDHLYLAEKEGYIIVVNKVFASHEIYEAPLDNSRFFASDKAFYFDDVYIDLSAKE